MKGPTLSLVALLAFSACTDSGDSGDSNRIIQLRDNLQQNPYDVESLAVLISYLESSHWLDPSNAAGCFRQLAAGPDNKKRIVPVIGPIVVHALIKNAENIGRESTNALIEYGELVEPYKADLVAILKRHPDEDMAWFAVEALGNLGPSAADTLPVIEALPQYETWSHIRESAIAKIKTEQGAAPKP